MIQKERYVVTGIDQDTAPDKRKPDTCFDSENIRLINNGRHLSIKPIGSSTEFVTSAQLGTSNIIIGSIEINDLLYIFTTDDAGSDRIASISTTGGAPTDIITGDFNFDSANRIEAVANFENEEIIKIYWTDGENQLRFINVEDPSSQINILEESNLGKATTTIQTGGNLTAGNIQYMYNMYNLNGSESILSKPSDIDYVTNYFAGGDTGDQLNISIEVVCPISATASTNYTNIRLYSVHWQEFNQTPTINLIADEGISSGDTTFTFVDDGNIVVSELSESEILSIGGRPLVVGTLAAKRNRLFVGNYSAANFDIDAGGYIDCRAFAHAISSTNYRVMDADGSNPTTYQLNNTPDEEADAVNADYDTYAYQQSNTNRGAEGVNIIIGFSTTSFSAGTIPRKSLKQEEIYRVGIVFYNSFGQASPVKWVVDIKVPRYSDLDNIISLTTQLKSTSIFTSAGAESYQMVAVERNTWDRTIVSQGFIVPGTRYEDSGSTPITPYVHPYYISKDILLSSSTQGGNIHEDFESGIDWDFLTVPADNTPIKDDEYMFFYSTDTMFENDLDSVSSIRTLGVMVAPVDGFSSHSTKLINYIDGSIEEVTSVSGLYFTGYRALFSPASTTFPDALLTGVTLSAGSEIKAMAAFLYKNYSVGFTLTDDDGGTPADVALEIPSEFITEGEIKAVSGVSTISNLVDVIVRPASQDIRMSATYSNSVLLKFSSTNWHYDVDTVTVPWGKFTGTQNSFRKLPIVELIRDLPNQYGGGTYAAKQRSSYLVTGDVSTITTAASTHYLGDMYIGPLHINRVDSEYAIDVLGNWTIYEYMKLAYLENNHNVFGRSDELETWSNGFVDTTNYDFFRITDNHQLLSAYNQPPNLFQLIGKPANFNTVDTFNNIIQASNLKFPNELIDSWTQFPENDTLALEGTYGNISKLHNFKGEVYAFQNSGIAHISINPRVQTQATDGVNIELGIGAVLYDHKYLTTVSGTSDKFTVADDGKSLFYYDGIYNTINILADDKISTLKGVRQILENSSGVISTLYNREQDEIMFSFSNFVLVYNSLLQKFVTRETETSANDHLMKLNDSVFFIDGSGNIAKKYNGVDYLPTSVTYLFSPAITTEKVFHNLEYRMFGDIDIENVQVTGNLNSSDLTAVTTFNKFDIRRLHLPRISGTRERFREPYILVEIQSNTGTTGDFSLDDMVIMYNIKG